MLRKKTLRGKIRVRFEDVKIIDEEEVPQKVKRADWLELFRKLPLGKAMIITAEQATPSSIREAMKVLKETGQLHSGFVFTAKKQDNGAYVSYVINSLGSAKRGAKSKRTADKASGIGIQDVVGFMKSKTDCGHTLHDLHMQFFGRDLSSRGADSVAYHRLYNLAVEARQRIEKETGKRFAVQQVASGTRIYKLQAA